MVGVCKEENRRMEGVAKGNKRKKTASYTHP